MQRLERVDIIYEPAAASEKAKILDAFDRAPDVGIWLAVMFHVACVTGLHELSLAERDIAQR